MTELEAAALPRPSLEGRVVLVTGGSLGIGRACAAEALDAGARVMIAARGESALGEAAAALGAGREARVAAAVADVAEPAAVDALVASVVERFGRLDGLVHAAAVPGPIGPATEIDPAEWLEAVRIDLFGSFLVARAAARAMRRTGGGRIVLFSGGGATFPLENYTAYGCSKAAVVRLAETLAAELAPHNIAVNSLAPGFVATRIHDATLAAGARAGENLRRVQEELAGGGVPAALGARAAVFLLSDAAEGITGKLVAAPWDAWWAWPERLAELSGSELFTLRRILPTDRGRDWQ